MARWWFSVVLLLQVNKRQHETCKKTETSNNTMKKLIIVSVALLVAGAVSVRAADAKVNWEKHCVKCHGQDGKGKTETGKELGVKDYTDPKVQAETNPIKMLMAIRKGVKEGEKTRMPAFGETLSVDEVRALMQYVRALKQ